MWVWPWAAGIAEMIAARSTPGHGGERAGVTGAHARAGAALLDEVDRHAHRGLFLAPDRLTRRLIHRDHLSRGHNLDAAADGARRCRQVACDLRRLPN